MKKKWLASYSIREKDTTLTAPTWTVIARLITGVSFIVSVLFVSMAFAAPTPPELPAPPEHIPAVEPSVPAPTPASEPAAIQETPIAREPAPAPGEATAPIAPAVVQPTTETKATLAPPPAAPEPVTELAETVEPESAPLPVATPEVEAPPATEPEKTAEAPTSAITEQLAMLAEKIGALEAKQALFENELHQLREQQSQEEAEGQDIEYSSAPTDSDAKEVVIVPSVEEVYRDEEL